MIVVDLNLLVYASNEDSPLHAAARTWWEHTVNEGTAVGLAWSVVLGFVRLTTNPRVMPRPLAPVAAFAIVDGWLEQPSVRMIEPTDRHWGLMKELLEAVGTAANLTTDAHLAALAIERGATLCSADRDFARFPRLKYRHPLA